MRLGVKVSVGVKVGVKVNVGVNGGVTSIDTLIITVRALVTVRSREINGSRLGRMGSNRSLTVTKTLCSLSLKSALVGGEFTPLQ